MSAATVLVVQHQENCPPALVGDWLTDAGLVLDVRRAYLGEELPPLTAYAGLLVLGGAMAAGADDSYPWLPVVRERILDAARAGIPTLGICLGHQLAALALGGSVEHNPGGHTIGLRQVDWEPPVLFDPLVRDIAGEDRAVFWNQDVVVTLPSGAELLASGLDGQVQAARLAPTVWGVQFHPEVDAAIARDWAAEDAETLAGLGLDAAELVDELDAAGTELWWTWQPFAEAYAGLVHGRAGAIEHLGNPPRREER